MGKFPNFKFIEGTCNHKDIIPQICKILKKEPSMGSWSLWTFLIYLATISSQHLTPTLVQHIKFIYLGFYVAFNRTVQVISRRVVERAEETSTSSLLGFCTVNCRPTASNYQLSHLRPCREPNPGLRGGRRECSHSTTVAPVNMLKHSWQNHKQEKCYRKEVMWKEEKEKIGDTRKTKYAAHKV